MAVSERVAREIDESGAVDSPQFSLRVEVSADTSASPDQVLAAASDFSEQRAQIWRNVTVKHLEVHERGDQWAEVTEGTTGPRPLLGAMPLRLVRTRSGDRRRT